MIGSPSWNRTDSIEIITFTCLQQVTLATTIVLCVAAVEWAHPEARLWPSAFQPCCFSIGTMATALLAWLSPTWTKLHLSMSLPQLVCLPLFLYVRTPPLYFIDLHWKRKQLFFFVCFCLFVFKVRSQSLHTGCCIKRERMFWSVTGTTARKINIFWTW